MAPVSLSTESLDQKKRGEVAAKVVVPLYSIDLWPRAAILGQFIVSWAIYLSSCIVYHRMPPQSPVVMSTKSRIVGSCKNCQFSFRKSASGSDDFCNKGMVVWEMLVLI